MKLTINEDIEEQTKLHQARQKTFGYMSLDHLAEICHGRFPIRKHVACHGKEATGKGVIVSRPFENPPLSVREA